jgi:hypothetical protein
MIRAVIIFIFVWVSLGILLQAFRNMNQLQVWSLVRVIAVSGACAVGAFAILASIVVLF